ncbi:MAG: class I SAM-dependent methyltransferase [Defluviitaleaceae bacterium]|nr:class I SAM-dependent methyltransferase [Defluviitaleaceae bacterium]
MTNDAIKNYWNKTASAETGWAYYHPNSPERFEDAALIAQNPERAFPAAVYPLIKKYMGNLNGKKVCVPSSGDNKAAFAFHMMGANVTSCDISANQLKNAKALADKFNWEIKFLCLDSMKLDGISDGEFDLVYTSNGAHVWISNMTGMYKNFYRILKPGGFNIFFETHPVIRPFDCSGKDIKIKKPYDDVEPRGNDLTYDWRTQDFINAIASAGFVIKEMQEFFSAEGDLDDYLPQEKDPKHENFGTDMKDWKQNPWAALPQCLFLCSQKKF